MDELNAGVMAKILGWRTWNSGGVILARYVDADRRSHRGDLGLEIGIETGPTWGPESALKRGPPQRTS